MKIKNKLGSYKAGLVFWITNTVISNTPSKRIRYYWLKLCGMSLSKNVKFYEGFHIREPKGITIAEGVTVGPKVLLDGRRGLLINENVVIAYEAIIWTLNHDYNSPKFEGKGSRVIIGRYAWICSRSMVLPGITIGEYAVVASNAVVTRDVPPYAIVAGIPAKIIGYREQNDFCYGYNYNSDDSHC